MNSMILITINIFGIIMLILYNKINKTQYNELLDNKI